MNLSAGIVAGQSKAISLSVTHAGNAAATSTPQLRHSEGPLLQLAA